MSLQPRFWLWAIALILSMGNAIAQEAYMTQIGSSNKGANVAVGMDHAQNLFQAGHHNVGVQYTEGSGNRSTLVQAEKGNHALTMIKGSGNKASATQIGFFNRSLIGIHGHDNSVDTLQMGAFNRSSVKLTGNETDVTVQQYGSGKHLDLHIADQMVTSSSAPATTGTTPAGRFQVGVIQNRHDAPVTTSITRQADGTVVIRP